MLLIFPIFQNNVGRAAGYAAKRDRFVHPLAARSQKSDIVQAMHSIATERSTSRPAMIAVGVFLLFGACMATLAGTTLVWPGTALDRVWAFNKTAHTQLSSAGKSVGDLFFFLSVTLIAASIGWFKRRVWGWVLAVGIISTQVMGDLGNLVTGDLLRGATGLAIAGALLFYLLRPNVRATFH